MSGQKLIKMDALRNSYEKLGLSSIMTYVQSGNVIFKSKDDEFNKLEQKISRQIEKDFGFNVPVIVLSINNLKQIIDNNPFLKDPKKEQTFLHVTFLSAKPDKYDFKTIEEKKTEWRRNYFCRQCCLLILSQRIRKI